MNLSQTIIRQLVHLPGWRTKRRIVVFESDDWGSIRTSSIEAQESFLAKGYKIDDCPYNRNDALESNEDLEKLFEVLTAVKDSKDQSAIITANNIVANPDFDRIKDAEYKSYHYENFTQTLKRYPKHDKVLDLYREGIEQNIFRPQFHGREHLNINAWLKSLQKGESSTHEAFEHSMFSIHTGISPPVQIHEFMDGLNINSEDQLKEQTKILEDGLRIFKSIWGFDSISFIAPCYIWGHQIESVLAKNGVKYLQGITNQRQPLTEADYSYKNKFHYQGQKNKHNQIYLVRNAFFEPSLNPDFDWISDCLQRIKTAFRWNKPAIVCTHRVNFIGQLNPENRENNLRLFKKLLQQIIAHWPEVEFLSSDQLGSIIEN